MCWWTATAGRGRRSSSSAALSASAAARSPSTGNSCSSAPPIALSRYTSSSAAPRCRRRRSTNPPASRRTSSRQPRRRTFPLPPMPRNNRGEGVSQTADSGKTRRAAGRGLDWLNLCVANVQTGFGPFLAAYLTTAGWTQTSIGLARSLGTITAMASQVPAGALVDAIRSKSRVAIFSILAFTASALMFTVAPIPLFIYLGQVLHAFSSCTLGPALVALSLAVAGQSALALRIGRNARFGAIGNAMGAALMGACGYYISERSVFLVTAALTLPAIVAILPIARFSNRPFPQVERRSPKRLPRKERIGRVLSDRRLLIFAA